MIPYRALLSLRALVLFPQKVPAFLSGRIAMGQEGFDDGPEAVILHLSNQAGKSEATSSRGFIVSWELLNQMVYRVDFGESYMLM